VDARLLVTAALAVGGLAVGVATVVLFFLLSGRRRAGLVVSVVPLALVVPAAAVCYESFSLIDTFSGMALSGAGTAAAVEEQLRQGWRTVCVTAGMVAGLQLLAATFALLPARENPDAPPCSLRRGLVLLALPVAGLVLAAGLGGTLRSAMRVSALVVLPNEGTAQDERFQRLLADEGLPTRGSAAIAATSQHIAWRATLGSVGAFAAMVTLLGLAVTTTLLAAPVRTGGGFLAAALVLALLVAGAASAVAAGWGHPLRLEGPFLSSAGSSP
jgi:hypothetical protein